VTVGNTCRQCASGMLRKEIPEDYGRGKGTDERGSHTCFFNFPTTRQQGMKICEVSYNTTDLYKTGIQVIKIIY